MTDRKNRAITVPAKGFEFTRGEDNLGSNVYSVSLNLSISISAFFVRYSLTTDIFPASSSWAKGFYYADQFSVFAWCLVLGAFPTLIAENRLTYHRPKITFTVLII